ncbi:MAG TPA: asparagine synthase (glutamine-hydrolyzing) [Vicinamibacterales bacterium]|nr:asparagine synthase (glutamine-hydrolyzing) [Vicinamibacterales bacterium]
MCGIAGFVGTEASPEEPREALVRRMAAAIRHRGPDDEGVYVDGFAALGMRRLAIIDVPSGRQPMTGEDRTVWVVFNGEIYNFRELAAELQALGHRFQTKSDTEVIVHAWEQWGEAALARLQGMFALAVWNAATRTLWLARDRPGIKPLHYTTHEGGLVFGSEIKSLLADPRVARRIDPQALDHYCSFLYTPPDRSIFAGVRKLPAGHVLRWQDGEVRTRRYWDLPPESFAGTEQDAAEQLRAILSRAVRSHMISDVPLGAFLSGGVDSSIVVGLMAEASGQPVKTFSIGFEEAAFNELPYAREVARRFGTDHHEFIVRPDGLSILDRLIGHFDEPFADSSAIPTWYVSEIASRHVKVFQWGVGGYVMFAGFVRYNSPPRVEAFDRLPIPGRYAAARVAWRHWPRRVRGRNLLRHVALDREARYVEDVGFFTADDKEVLYTPAFTAALNGADPFAEMRRAFEGDRHLPWPSQMMRFDFRTYLANDGLPKVDRMSMAHSIESRVPLLDTSVVEFAASLPPRFKITPGGRQKHILKESVADILPRAFLDRKKQGFAVPVGSWFGSDLRGLFADTLLSSRARERGYFQPGAVQRLVDDHVSGRRDHTLRLWVLVVFELWQRQYVDDHAGVVAA